MNPSGMWRTLRHPMDEGRFRLPLRGQHRSCTCFPFNSTPVTRIEAPGSAAVGRTLDGQRRLQAGAMISRRSRAIGQDPTGHENVKAHSHADVSS
jgi:hypothetical protein